MKKLKTRLDAFSDAVIAIILTIMVLDLTPVLKDSAADYLLLSKEIGVYIISFAFVANMWYQHATLFNEIDDMSYRIMLYDFIFLIPLSLTPLATNMMAENTTKITVTAYGLLVGITGACFRLLARGVIHFQYTDTSKMRQVYHKVFGQHNLIYVLLNLVLIVLAYFFPQIILWFYLPYPLVYLLLSSRDRQQMYDVAQLTTNQRQQYLRLPRDQMKQFRQLVETQKAAKGTGAARSISAQPISWVRWLDQPIGAGAGKNGGHLDAEAIRELRRAQWDEFERLAKHQKTAQQQAADEREAQQDAQKAAARQAKKERQRQLEAQKDAAEQAAKQRDRDQEDQEAAAKLAAKNIERQAKAKREAAKQEIKIQERQQKAKRKADRKDAKALIRQKKLAQKAKRYDSDNQDDQSPK
jgi:uncharacterized membrane protein